MLADEIGALVAVERSREHFRRAGRAGAHQDLHRQRDRAVAGLRRDRLLRRFLLPFGRTTRLLNDGA